MSVGYRRYKLVDCPDVDCAEAFRGLIYTSWRTNVNKKKFSNPNSKRRVCRLVRAGASVGAIRL
jgi:hypothetical protein